MWGSMPHRLYRLGGYSWYRCLMNRMEEVFVRLPTRHPNSGHPRDIAP